MEGKLDTYRRVDTLGKSQLDLILQVYDGAIRACDKAREHYGRSENEAGYEEMERAKRFVTHLYTTLDPEKGGEVAANLGRLYVHVISQSYVVQATKDLQELENITNVMRNLREGWAGLKEQDLAEKSTEAVGADSAPADNGQFVTTA